MALVCRAHVTAASSHTKPCSSKAFTSSCSTLLAAPVPLLFNAVCINVPCWLSHIFDLAFSAQIDFGRDVEQHLNVLVDFRRSFPNLEAVKDRLVLRYPTLSSSYLFCFNSSDCCSSLRVFVVVSCVCLSAELLSQISLFLGVTFEFVAILF